MATGPGAKRRTAKLPAGRVGRPPREQAGEVDARILDAARRVFLEHGLAGASIDEIANVARAGKPTIYARFPGKEALFAAVVMSNVAATAARFEGHVPTGSTLDERLAKAAQSDTLGALPAFTPQRLATSARFFIDLVVWPIVVRALFGEKLKDLRAEVEPDVTRSVAFFLAACRSGGGA